MKRGALQTVFLHPLGSAREDVLAVVIETQHERTIDLDSVVVQNPNAAGVLGRFRSFLAGVGQILVGERLETHKYAGAASQGHGSNQTRIVGDVDGDSRAPNLLERSKSVAKRAQVFAPRSQIVVDEDGVRLAVLQEFRGDLR